MVDRSYLLKTVQSMPQLKTVRKSREKNALLGMFWKLRSPTSQLISSRIL